MARTFRSIALGTFLAAGAVGFSPSASAFFGLDNPLGGAASGALIGGIAGGGKGAAIGALSGALVGGVVQESKKKQ